MPTACCAGEKEKELVALSATRGVSLCWGQEQAEVAGVSGAMVTSATWRGWGGSQGTKGTGEKHSGAAGQGETAGAKLYFATSNNGGCAVAISGRALGLGLCSNSPSQGMGLLQEEERLGYISHQCSKNRPQQRKRKSQGYAREGRRLQITSNGE